MNTTEFAGCAILVTGATRGIGAAIARRLAAGGARVALHGRDAEGVRAACAALGTAAIPVVGDFSDPQQAAAAVREVVRVAGRIDGLVNNAGAGRAADGSDGVARASPAGPPGVDSGSCSARFCHHRTIMPITAATNPRLISRTRK